MTKLPNAPRTIAFYLPQFHAVPENDSWWGAGFTEWTNVRKAKPLFEGHDHPRVPVGLGYYDLADPEPVMREQARSAAASGIDGFCFYVYWFDGARLLERPVDWYSTHGPDFPFCVSWANESWTRRWDGKDHEVLMPQTYRRGFAADIFFDFLPYFRSPAYMRHEGKPVFVVHRVDQIPQAADVADEWRRLALESGLGGIHLVASETKPGLTPAQFGFDAIVEFPPVGSNTLGAALVRPVEDLAREFSGRLLSYGRLAKTFMERRAPTYVRYPGVTPGWDNTARRGDRATVYVGSDPETYRLWLSSARARESAARGDKGFVFVNAWNEWAEGAYLEPDSTWGERFALATRWDAVSDLQPSMALASGRWSLSQVRSIAILTLGSGVSWVRHIRNTLASLTRRLKVLRR